MAIERIKAEDLQYWAERAGLRLEEHELDQYQVLAEAMFDNLDTFDQESPEVGSAVEARSHTKPSRESDPYNALINACVVQPSSFEGLLEGKRIGLKDNIAVAGVPMTLGSALLTDFVPSSDSLVAERVLEQGGSIVAKLNLDAFAWSGGAETSDFGPILNPHDTDRTAGGSSGGSAAALYYEDVDITFGTDQGGSIRLPASWCGVLGLKPTWGLVPYTGIVSLERTFDYVGPLARNVEDLAIALDSVSGQHWSDSRQAGVSVRDTHAAVVEAQDDLLGLSVGVLDEGFGFQTPDSPDGVQETEDAVGEAIERVSRLGANVRRVSIPEHRSLMGMIFAILLEGQSATLSGFGNGYHWHGRYMPDLAEEFGRILKSERANSLPPTVKLVSILGVYLKDRYSSSLYAVAQNVSHEVRELYDKAFREVDLLLMPTATHFAHRHLPNLELSERVLRGWSMIGNTPQFNLSGHPALSMPAAEVDGLPVGLMVVGKPSSEDLILKFARTYEMNYGWLPEGRSA